MNTQPVPIPMLTNSLVDAIEHANIQEGKRPKAFDTLFRHSDAAKCARQIGFSHLSFGETDPMDLAGHWVTFLGKKIHEEWQEEFWYLPDSRKRFTEFQPEFQVQHGDLCSGHLDALITTSEGVTICYELKTMGSFGFDKATGLMRKNWARKEPEGPRLSAIIQGSLNAVASNADLLVIGIIGLEAMSKGYAEKVGASDLDRIMAEWHYTRDEFEPLAIAELQRLEEIKGYIDRGELPPRWALNDKGYSVNLDPMTDDDWNCVYCPYRSLCIQAGPQARIGDLRDSLKEEVDATL